jgi:uncharacterized protein DUF4339
MNRGVNASIWLWATESGEQHAGSEQELVTCLSSRALPPYTLVWRSGWGEWLPAMQVAELARGVLESSNCAPRTARATAPGVPPPPPPIDTYPTLRRWAEELQQASGPITRREGLPVWAQTVVLNESPASVDPDEITGEIPLEVLQEAARLMMEPTPPVDLGIAEGVRRSRTSLLPVAPPDVDAFRTTPDASPVSRSAASVGVTPEELEALGEMPSRSHGRRWLWLLPVAGMAAALWYVRAHGWPGKPASAPEPQVAVLPMRTTASAAEPAPSPPKVFGCRVLERPQKLDDWVVPEGPLGMALAPDGKRIALGFAQSHERAIGISFDPSRFAPLSSEADGSDPASIGLSREFMQYREEQIYSVTPLSASGKLEFRVERVGEKLALGTAIDGVPTLRVGMNEFGVVGGLLGRRPHRIWWLPRPALTSVPAYTRHPLGYLIAARVGRKDPTIRVGVISPEAVAHTSLSTLELPKGPVGIPVLAGKATVMALAVVVEAERAVAGDRLMLARATPTELPLTAEPLEAFGGAPVQLANPALAALGGEGFALTWSEGVGEQRRVRLLLLDDALAPRGEPIELSLPELEHGGAINGALFWANERLFSFFYLRRPEGYSLWANRLTCGEY